MKILFSNPPWFEVVDGSLRKGVRAGSRWPNTSPARSRQDHWTDGHYIPFPFFMAYASSYAAKHTGEEVVLRDSIALHEGYQAYYDYLKAARFDMIFLESATPCWEHDRGVIEKIHHSSPESILVMTGPITVTRGQEILDTLPIAACIHGEYEKGSVRVIRGERGIIAHDMLSREEMNAAPFPTFNVNEAWRYFDACPHSPLMPHAQVWSSRGCPYACRFCSWPATMTNNDPDGTGKRTVRHYSEAYMEAYLSEIVAKCGFRSIYFDDDTFNLGNKHVERMCKVMRKINLPWSAMCRADSSTPEIWTLMRDSGCYGVKVGFESGNQELVDTVINKGLDLKEARKTVIFLRKLGLTVHGTFTYGHPGETRAQMLETRAFIRSMPLNSWQESGTALLDGTPMGSDAAAGKLGEGFSLERDGNLKFSAIREQLKHL